jgi:polar amino acid transport system substrate-binding protein
MISLTALFFLTLFFLIPFPLCAQSTEPPIRLAARNCPSFVINDSGQYSGLSIFLFDNIAEKLGFEYRVEEYGLKEMLEAVAQGKADVGVSCLSITQKREETIDFSHSFFETHLAIAVRQHGFLHSIKNFFYNKKLGTKGIDYMRKDAAKSPLKMLFTAPSCVPATPFETSGAVLGLKDQPFQGSTSFSL